MVVGGGGGGGGEADGRSGIDLARRRGGILGICAMEKAEIGTTSLSRCFIQKIKQKQYNEVCSQ